MIQAYVKYRGTVDCLVAFRLSKAQMKQVKEFYGKTSDQPLVFLTGEVACQGNGWYHAFGNELRSDGTLRTMYVDGALRVLRNIEFALANYDLPEWKTRQQVRETMELQRVARVYKTVKRLYIPVKVMNNGNRKPFLLAKNRALQASRNRIHAEAELRDQRLIQALLASPPKPVLINHSLVSQLNAKFGH